MNETLEVYDVEIRLNALRTIGPLSFAAGPGNLVVITGGAGSGKSSLLEVVAGSRTPNLGRVLHRGKPPRFGDAGIVTQRHDLLGGLTAVENIAVRVLGGPASFSSPEHSKDWRRQRNTLAVSEIEQLLASLTLPASSWHNLVEQLSGGQQQRVALARALVGTPDLIALDDPTSELDEATAEIVLARVEQAAQAGAVVVVATDDPAFIARATRVVTLLERAD
jgi:ABC-type lipoprotein export system ATPase subunit